MSTIQKPGIWRPERDLLLPRIRRYRTMHLHKQPLGARIGIGNWYRLEAVGHYGSRWLTPWFHNNITDVGLDLCATNTTRYAACQAGTGTAAPSNSDTGLQSYAAGTSTRTFISNTSNLVTPPYYWEIYWRYDFLTGAINGNITEVQVGTSSSGGSCFSRELVRDSGGSPTAISVTSAEALRVHYKVRHYAPTDDVLGSIMIGANSHNTIRRAAALSTGNKWTIGSTGGVGAPTFGSAVPGLTTVRSGALNTVFGEPGGQLGTSTSGSSSPYSPGAFSRISSFQWATSVGNGNIRSMLLPLGDGNPGRVQIELDPVIVKTSFDVLTLETRVDWGRYVAP